MIRIVTITEGEVGVEEFDYTQGEAEAWCDGFASGGGHYGAGECYAVTKETVDDYMDPADSWTDAKQRAKVLKALKMKGP